MIGSIVRRGRKYQKNRRCNVKKEAPGRARRRNGNNNGHRVRRRKNLRKKTKKEGTEHE